MSNNNANLRKHLMETKGHDAVRTYVLLVETLQGRSKKAQAQSGPMDAHLKPKEVGGATMSREKQLDLVRFLFGSMIPLHTFTSDGSNRHSAAFTQFLGKLLGGPVSSKTLRQRGIELYVGTRTNMMEAMKSINLRAKHQFSLSTDGWCVVLVNCF